MSSVDNDSVFNDSMAEPFCCPVCYEFMSKKIFTCSNGHSFCHVCILKVSKCPICKVKIISRRNINLEKAAKKFQELKQANLLPSRKGRSSEKKRSERLSLPADDETDKTLIPVLRRKLRRSLGGLGTPTRPQPSQTGRASLGGSTVPVAPVPAVSVQTDRIDYLSCPLSNCCYSTKKLWEIKIHLQTWHPSKVCPVKKMFENQSEKHMRVRITWNIHCVQTIFVLSSEQAYFVIYITKRPDPEEKFFINVLTISDKTSIYKFSLGTQTEFSMFYQGTYQAANGGIEVSTDQIEREDDKFKIKLYISKVASLIESENALF